MKRLELQVRRINAGWSFAHWREDQYRPATVDRYRALVIDVFKWRFEFRVPKR